MVDWQHDFVENDTRKNDPRIDRWFGDWKLAVLVTAAAAAAPRILRSIAAP
jgi:hypothetical protein